MGLRYSVLSGASAAPTIAATSKPRTPLHASQFVPADFTYDEQNPPSIIPCPGFQVELGSAIDKRDIEVTLEHPEHHTLYYRDNIANSAHINFVNTNLADPVIISAQFLKALTEFKVLVRTKKGDYHMTVPAPTTKSRLLTQIQQKYQLTAETFKEVKDPNIRNDLLHLEDRLLIRNYKFGVIYCKEGQTTDDEMFSNEVTPDNPAPLFEEFLGMLGEKVKLKDFPGYDGELDTKADTTGTHSIYTRKDNFDIMFHVSTYLPFSSTNKQQIERKRHIGNDIVCIIFQDGDSTPFTPTAITSKYNHVYIVVQVVKNKAASETQPPPRKSSSSSTGNKRTKRSRSRKPSHADNGSSSASNSSSSRHRSNSKHGGNGGSSLSRRSTMKDEKELQCNGSSSTVVIPPSNSMNSPVSPTTSRDSTNMVMTQEESQKNQEDPDKLDSSRSHGDKGDLKHTKNEKKQPPTQYRIAVVSKPGVVPFGPLLPSEPTWTNGSEFKEFLLTKVINAERGSYNAPPFRLSITRRDWLKDIINKYS
jgi:hypothetical protein